MEQTEKIMEVVAMEIKELEKKFADFRRAYYEDGMQMQEFDNFGPTRRTLRQFAKATDDIIALVRDFMIPNPDI